MKTHVGVDLHQRFCYLTAVDASGKTCKQGQVVNEGAALRAWLRQFRVPGRWWWKRAVFGLRLRGPWGRSRNGW